MFDNLVTFGAEETEWESGGDSGGNPPSSTPWLGAWAKRIEISFDNTKIDANLTNFPVLLNLSTAAGISSADLSDIFTDIADADRKKIAVTSDDGQTQLPVEIVFWDATNEVAEVWVKVPSVASSEETSIWLYYDPAQGDNSAIVGDTGDACAADVWNSWYKHVYHLQEGNNLDTAPDSLNTNDLTGTSYSGETPVLVDAKIGKGIDFEEAENHQKNGGNGYDLYQTSAFTLEAWINPESNTQTYHSALILANGSTDSIGLRLYNKKANVIAVLQGTSRNLQGTVDVPLSQWTYLCGRWAENENLDLFENDIKFTAGPYTGTVPRHTNDVRVGDTSYTNGREWDGIVDEVRISHLKLPDAMVKANYYSGGDDLVSYGAYEEYSAGSGGDDGETAAGGMILCVPVAPVIVPTAAFAKLATVTAGMQAADGKTDLYTVPTGKSAIITHVIIRNPTASLAGATDFDLGDGANADTWKTAIDLSSLSAATDALIIDLNTKFTVFDAGDVFGIKPVTGSTADADATIDVFGYEF
jgi:hypothetical protein